MKILLQMGGYILVLKFVGCGVLLFFSSNPNMFLKFD